MLLPASAGRLRRGPRRAGCNIALYYYSGFSYLQLRRYLDAARAFNAVLTYIARCGRGRAPLRSVLLCSQRQGVA